MLNPINILLVDDSPEDIDLTMEAMAGTKLANHISFVNDGTEAMNFLRRKGKFTNAPRPSLILLDLNMPKKDGRETLREIKQDAALCEIPVVIFTTSKREEDISQSYQLHANCYVAKPVNMKQFYEVAQVLESFWFAVAELPGQLANS